MLDVFDIPKAELKISSSIAIVFVGNPDLD